MGAGQNNLSFTTRAGRIDTRIVILIGLFIYQLAVQPFGGFSGLAGCLALAVLVPALDPPGGLPMADVPGAIHIDARTIVDRVRSEGAESENPRGWLPQGTFDELLEESARERGRRP